MSNQIEFKKIQDLNGFMFNIPTYQRGYRWGNEQVEELLEDIYDFSITSHNLNDFYCLQPVVVKLNGKKYNVVDGQQRLTTIFLVLKYFKQLIFTLEYEIRNKSADFLQSVDTITDHIIIESNPDFYYMKNAYNAIEKWFNDKKVHDPSVVFNFPAALLAKCEIIWYLCDYSENEYELFTRLNIGKIELTNSELIKALLLQKKNFKKEEELRQIEIAKDWDRIENELQNDELWYFINPKTLESSQTRIDFIFSSMTGDKYSQYSRNTFKYFCERKEKEETIEIWKSVKEYFNIILEWFNNPYLYHLVGFITTTKLSEIDKLIGEYFSKNYKKDEFVLYIENIVINEYKDIDIENLNYGDNSKEIKEILLLFNILTIIKNPSSCIRFPFDKYVKEKWSLEHIHAQNADGMTTKELWQSWIVEHEESFKHFDDTRYEEVVAKLKNAREKSITEGEFITLFEEISTIISSDYGTDLHKISNLALIKNDDNSTLSNSFFDVKRRKIIEMEKNNSFIPPCTRNVFMKYYSKDLKQIHYWSENDRNDYLECIIKTLNEFKIGV